MMAAIILFVLLAWATITVAPTTPIGRFLFDAMVRRPAILLARITQGHVALLALALAAAGSALFWGGAEFGRIVVMALPDFTAWALTFEIATYLDIAVAFVATVSFVRGRAMIAFVSRPIARRRAASRTRRAVRPIRPEKAANDDEERRPLSLIA